MKGAVAVAGRAQEAPCRLLLQALRSQGIPMLLLDQQAQRRAFMTWGLDTCGRLHGHAVVNGTGYALDQLAGIYLRLADDSSFVPPDALPAAMAWTQGWMDACELAECRVVNRMSAMVSNGSKPYQSQCLAQAGFAIPEMLLTNDPQAVRDFEARHGPLIYKSASGVRSIVSTLDDASRRRLEAVRRAPTLFQKRLRGTNVRVHVVGDEIFATEIDSDVVDYRYAARQGGNTTLRATRLSLDIEALCRRAARALGLSFAGLDLMLADDGLTYCFEANPSPGYSFYEEATGQPVSSALARYLAGTE